MLQLPRLAVVALTLGVWGGIAEGNQANIKKGVVRAKAEESGGSKNSSKAEGESSRKGQKKGSEKKAGKKRRCKAQKPRRQRFTHVVALDAQYYKGGPQQGRPPDGTFRAGTKVILLKEQTGSYVLVQSEGGITAFVSTGSLKKLADWRAKAGRGAEYVKVQVRGKLVTGIAAIGGETTGAQITAKGITWELDFRRSDKLRKLAEKLNGKTVIVKGTLERREGIEVRKRWIVTVAKLSPASAKP